MRASSFGVIEQGWSQLSIGQWRELLAACGAPSQEQCRTLVDGLRYAADRRPASAQKQLLRRVMCDMGQLSPQEKQRWWKAIAEYPSAIHVALARGLDFERVDRNVARDVMTFNLRHHPAVAGKIWDTLLPIELRKSILPHVVDAWLDTNSEAVQKHWGVRLDAHILGMDDKHRMTIVCRALAHTDDLLDNGDGPSGLQLQLLKDLVVRFAPPRLTLLTRFASKIEDKHGIIAPLASQEQRVRLDETSCPAPHLSNRSRL